MPIDHKLIPLLQSVTEGEANCRGGDFRKQVKKSASTDRAETWSRRNKRSCCCECVCWQSVYLGLELVLDLRNFYRGRGAGAQFHLYWDPPLQGGAPRSLKTDYSLQVFFNPHSPISCPNFFNPHETSKIIVN